MVSVSLFDETLPLNIDFQISMNFKSTYRIPKMIENFRIWTYFTTLLITENQFGPNKGKIKHRGLR